MALLINDIILFYVWVFLIGCHSFLFCLYCVCLISSYCSQCFWLIVVQVSSIILCFLLLI